MFTVSSAIAFEGTVSKRKHSQFEPAYNFCELFSYKKYLQQYFHLPATLLERKQCTEVIFKSSEGMICSAALELPSVHSFSEPTLSMCYMVWGLHFMMLGGL